MVVPSQFQVLTPSFAEIISLTDILNDLYLPFTMGALAVSFGNLVDHHFLVVGREIHG